MADTISPIRPDDLQALTQVDGLLAQEGIRRDRNLDYTCAIYDGGGQIVATGSCFGSTLRCLAVSRCRQGTGLLNQLVTHLINIQYARGNVHLFLCTKPAAAPYFEDLGFYEIARAADFLVFMENRRRGFHSYLQALAQTCRAGHSAALVMNANPFTLGHQYLVETAAAQCDALHLFLLSEDMSLVPFPVRKRLAVAGTAHLDNVILHDSGPYMISSATFPSYFLKDDAAIAESHARLDVAVFCRVAGALGITARYVGEEPNSPVTNRYNQIMAEELPKAEISCVIVPRKAQNGVPISASAVRKYLKEGNLAGVKALVPAAVFDYFASAEAQPVLDRIRQAGTVSHNW